MDWLYLSIAIFSEVLATSALKSADGFSRLYPSLLVIAGYSCAFYFLSLTLRTVPMGIVYAVWSGAGIVLISLVGWFFYQQKLDLANVIGIGLILLGVVVLKIFSKPMLS
jgi:small multidrug resistance pump